MTSRKLRGRQGRCRTCNEGFAGLNRDGLCGFCVERIERAKQRETQDEVPVNTPQANRLMVARKA